ncbi:lipoyltransferase and lipoate-protein ligase subfamily protein [Cardiosporidium cionae]|uniref:lipoate--protein ligase n=1 Tax=Cardiosporidium cionae TaxID=476202 RepID=A0ABQ7J5S0_9APIC|nr:lipoyltransferase and lipoate-protein ligase subfamily protein [Cardiosporidium cionae]|eukprot:KAF8819342.1 lipoyltransferase and lipoate-protein ligase subfamily protein [Cardiosporidium cionae]
MSALTMPTRMRMFNSPLQRCFLNGKTGCSFSSTAALYVAHKNNIYTNLAFENYLIEKQGITQHILFLWRNDKTVVIGRHQNPWSECNISRMQQDNVNLCRRYSGGGTVYQDLGNTCFTFLSPKHQFDIGNNNKIILAALLNGFGITGEVSGRNDLSFENRKFSGSAYKYLPNISLHHGTLMLDVDHAALAQYLTPHKLKLQSKGIDSVSSRVINLKTVNPSISHEKLLGAISEEFKKFYKLTDKELEVQFLYEDSSFFQEKIFKEHHAKLTSWDWNYGKTPSFSHKMETRFDWGTFEIFLTVENGVVKSGKIFSDCLYSDLVESLEAVLSGISYSAEDISKALKYVESNVAESLRTYVQEYSNWICSEISA